jgi:hypothetical protein
MRRYAKVVWDQRDIRGGRVLAPRVVIVALLPHGETGAGNSSCGAALAPFHVAPFNGTWPSDQ